MYVILLLMYVILERVILMYVILEVPCAYSILLGWLRSTTLDVLLQSTTFSNLRYSRTRLPFEMYHLGISVDRDLNLLQATLLLNEKLQSLKYKFTNEEHP
ncbi:hypothetical protein BT93_A1766 [Corymbia citriodora subsp. variegata]|nr:hypothetical protein BT93_A1766 [Corymbia citriodora subsp. variegata]